MPDAINVAAGGDGGGRLAGVGLGRQQMSNGCRSNRGEVFKGDYIVPFHIRDTLCSGLSPLFILSLRIKLTP